VSEKEKINWLLLKKVRKNSEAYMHLSAPFCKNRSLEPIIHKTTKRIFVEAREWERERAREKENNFLNFFLFCFLFVIKKKGKKINQFLKHMRTAKKTQNIKIRNCLSYWCWCAVKCPKKLFFSFFSFKDSADLWW
jgi:hypothetical protein